MRVGPFPSGQNVPLRPFTRRVASLLRDDLSRCNADAGHSAICVRPSGPFPRTSRVGPLGRPHDGAARHQPPGRREGDQRRGRSLSSTPRPTHRRGTRDLARLCEWNRAPAATFLAAVRVDGVILGSSEAQGPQETPPVHIPGRRRPSEGIIKRRVPPSAGQRVVQEHIFCHG